MEVYELEDAITFGNGEPITELKLRKPVAGDWRGCKMEIDVSGRLVFDVDVVLTVASRIPGHPRPALAEMSQSDLTQVGAIIMGFSVPGRQTGSAS